MKHGFIFIALLSLLAPACRHRQETATAQSTPVTVIPTPPPADTSADYLLQATLWFQQSAEYRSLCLQTYRLARLALDEALRTPSPKKPAVVVDIDETVLDNSPYTAWQILNGKEWSQDSWQKWTLQSRCDSIPGAPGFLNYAASRGVETFYISNRNAGERDATLRNLQALGFPWADTSHIFLRTTESTKEPRRQKIMETHTILLLCGDNVEDFSNAFEKKSNADRKAQAAAFQAQWGSRFIMLPNPLYGSWEGGMNPDWRKMSLEQRDSVRRASLRGF